MLHKVQLDTTTYAEYRTFGASMDTPFKLDTAPNIDRDRIFDT